MKGFTLIEILIVIGITALITSAAFLSFSNYRQRQILDSSVRSAAAIIREANQKSINQESGQQWGVHFENLATGRDFYALFTGAVYISPVQIFTLPAGVVFIDPAAGMIKEVIFEKLTGIPNIVASVTLTLASDSGISKTITINDVGQVIY